MRRFRVIKHIRDTVFIKLWPGGEMRDMLGFDWFQFPEVGTILETDPRGTYVKYGKYAVCDIGTNLFNECFEEVFT